MEFNTIFEYHCFLEYQSGNTAEIYHTSNIYSIIYSSKANFYLRKINIQAEVLAKRGIDESIWQHSQQGRKTTCLILSQVNLTGISGYRDSMVNRHICLYMPSTEQCQQSHVVLLHSLLPRFKISDVYL